MRMRLVLVLMLAWIFTGCAMTMDRVNVDYKSPELNTENPNLKASLLIGKFKDKRGLEDPSIIIHKTNLNGQTTSGGYQADKPLSEIIEKALQDYFSRYRVLNSDKQYTLYGSIIELEYEVISGWISTTLKPELSMKFYLKDLSTNQVVWNETYFGRGVVKKFSGSEDAINKMLQASLDDILNQLSNSERLFNYL